MSPTGDLLVTFIFLWGRCPLELAQRPSCVALVLHLARRSTPFRVTIAMVGGGWLLVVGWLVVGRSTLSNQCVQASDRWEPKAPPKIP